MANQTLSAYDQIPYLANPLPQTHPSRLAAVASMFALSFAPPKNARVLELGCASGINLLGMAHFMPEAKFVGIDLSIVQIHEAQRRAKAINAENVTFHHMGIEDIDANFGEFDYVLCHGVYSWVPPSTQKAILRICNENLSQDGIGFVSYNVQPGWRIKQIARDVFWALTPPEMPASKRYEYGVAWIKDALEITAKEEQKPLLHQALANEMNSILTQKDIRYLVHEYIEDNNEPLLFREFLSQVSEAGLAYLGDAEPASMVRHLTNPALREFFKTHPATSMAEAEQAIDIIMGRTFRQSLLVKGIRHRQINRALTSAFFKNLHIQARIARKVDENNQVTYTHPRAGQMNAQPPYGTAALDVLAEAFMPTEFRKLADKFTELSQGTDDVFAEILFSLLGAGAIEIFADPYIPELPKGATPLALLDVSSGRNITSNAAGEVIGLDPLQSLILPLLKGDWDREDVISHLAGLYGKGAFNINPVPADNEQMRNLLGNLADKAANALKMMGVVG
ncbi:MAG: class I SAM-dependent methyltransferase [Holophagales bacterium]|nr:class I SAM-dependent methyltransferase [Holophagales bacterium]